MGDTKKARKSYSKPGHPWQTERIRREKEFMKEYGMKNKKELWKMTSLLKNFSKQAKNLIATGSVQAEREKGQLLQKLNLLGLVAKDSGIDNVLGLQLRDVLERRLQTIVFRKKLARSVGQARQLITHEHIAVGDRKITSPSYLVSSAEEARIAYSEDSGFNNAEHPERPVDKDLELAKKTRIIKKEAESKTDGETAVEGKKAGEKPKNIREKKAETPKKTKGKNKEESLKITDEASE